MLIVDSGLETVAVPGDVRVVGHGAGRALARAVDEAVEETAVVVEAVSFANAAAALFVSTPADQKKTVTSDQVTRFLSERRQPLS